MLFLAVSVHQISEEAEDEPEELDATTPKTPKALHQPNVLPPVDQQNAARPTCSSTHSVTDGATGTVLKNPTLKDDKPPAARGAVPKIMAPPKGSPKHKRRDRSLEKGPSTEGKPRSKTKSKHSQEKTKAPPVQPK